MNITLTVYGSLLLNIVVSVLLPMVVALVSKQAAHPGLKAILLLAVNAVYGFLSGWAAVGSGHPFDLKTAAMTALVGFAWSVLAHYGVLKPLGVTGSAGAIQINIPGGIGGSSSRV